ncbi:hypothetical protein [Streptococcus pyogenes]|uniref:hypothetical protein n=1 Tax=Streptococcus pyogenes TaxID=1314 RepID=UPI0010A13955|nr:hypothetical protein [Streptococcus pyogenes]VGW24427.1 Uncharacterised protein [Streptococcus pyogenes]VGW28191.1 Uncharacterised protein [Streptococcus pyogenes]VGW29101.1 Uncharacterised protein [Streptococcus pyogenes]VGW36344.1 Uncharacterised protein [Streptococcus pyogenes]VGW38719.1 Uncharacterised protein [Streptococcus pyogenes]
MKTKSKRFLNLATLCLALLGTTLLMARPVKAEVVKTDASTISGSGEGEESDKYWWNRGHTDGYKEGEKSEIRKDLDRKTFSNFPEGLKDDDYENRGEYMDGYETGYSEGWHSKHGYDGSNDGDTDSNQTQHSQEEKESGDPSQGDRGRQGSVDSSSQQEDTDIISPIVDTVLQAVLDVWSGFLSWLGVTI